MGIMLFMQLLFWASLFLIISSYLGYPLFLVILTLFIKKPYEKKDIEPSVTLLIPAHNEERVIKNKIENTLTLDYPKNKLEVIIILDECTDKTKDILSSYIKDNIKIIEQKPRKGKMAALNMAIAKASGEIILFSDANSIYKKDVIRKIIRNFKDARIGCVCGELRYKNSPDGDKEVEGVYWKYERFLKIRESLLQSLLVVNGSIYAIRKELFEEVEESLADDFVIPMRIAKKGYGLVYEPEARATEKPSESIKDEFNRKVRITSQGIKAFFLIFGTIFSSGLLRVLQFIFHKLIRWFVFMLLIFIAISNIYLVSYGHYRVLLGLQIFFYLFAIMGYVFKNKKVKLAIFNIPLYFCIVNLASMVGFIRFISGNVKGPWQKARSTR